MPRLVILYLINTTRHLWRLVRGCRYQKIFPLCLILISPLVDQSFAVASNPSCSLLFSNNLPATRNVSKGKSESRPDKHRDFDQKMFLDPVTLQDLDSRKIGELIVDRIFSRSDLGRDPSQTIPQDNFSEVVMMASLDKLKLIAKHGFKNQHQVGTSGGSIDYKIRLEVESRAAMIGLAYTTKTREILPKYGLQIFHTTDLGNLTLPDIYGDIIVRFKSDVKRRSTWAYGDSLWIDRYESLDDQRWPLRTNRIFPKKGRVCWRYCEAQIWGELDFTDVESIMIPEHTPVSEELKALGLPIRTYRKAANKLYKQQIPPLGEVLTDSVTNISYFLDGRPIPTKPITERPDLSQAAIEAGLAVTDTTARFWSNPNLVFVPDRAQNRATDVAEMRTLELPTGTPQSVEDSLKFESRLGTMTTDELIKAYERMPMFQPLVVGRRQDDQSLSQPKVKLLAELAGRKLTGRSAAMLIREFRENQNYAIRYAALSGLSTSPTRVLKPILLNAMKDDDSLIQQTAIFLAISLKYDPEVRQALESTTESHELLRRSEAKYFSDEKDPLAR